MDFSVLNIFLEASITDSAWKYGIGAILTICSGAVAGVWRYFTSEREKMGLFFLEERKVFRTQLDKDAELIKELNQNLSNMRDDHLKELKVANEKLEVSNRILNEKLLDRRGESS